MRFCKNHSGGKLPLTLLSVWGLTCCSQCSRKLLCGSLKYLNNVTIFLLWRKKRKNKGYRHQFSFWYNQNTRSCYFKNKIRWINFLLISPFIYTELNICRSTNFFDLLTDTINEYCSQYLKLIKLKRGRYTDTDCRVTFALSHWTPSVEMCNYPLKRSHRLALYDVCWAAGHFRRFISSLT